MITTWGGLGDQICAEPTIRYAIKYFKDCDITLATDQPELFQHLAPYLKDVYDTKIDKPIYSDYFVFQTIHHTEDLAWEFISHCIVNCVDYPALSAFRCQLPVADREIMLKPETPRNPFLHKLVSEGRKHVVVHAGRHWPSKTFPVAWWNRVLESIKQQNLIPVLIGREGGEGLENQGTVATSTEGCIDLRNQCSIMDSVWLLQNMPVLICNDSSPMHMAASGEAFIGFIATCKHPDFIMHFRRGQWAWREHNFGLGGLWEQVDNLPNKTHVVKVDECDPELLKTFLPEPEIIGPWCTEKINAYFQQA